MTETPTICRLCSTAYPDLMDDFRRNGCEGDGGEHTPAAVVLATVLAASVNGASTTDVHAQSFLEDALHLLRLLGPASTWSVAQDEAEPHRWTVNGIPLVLDFGATNEGPGDLEPVVPDRVCPECKESVGWRYLVDQGERVEIECKGCGELLEVDRWWPHVEPPQPVTS